MFRLVSIRGPLATPAARPARSRFTMATFAALFALAPLAEAAEAPDPIRFMRDPHVAHGMITFSYHGDIWIANRDGTDARRLTNHVAREVAPRFSPDGRLVAFSSNRFGNDDVFVVPVEGGEPTQLTFHTGGDVVGGWTPDGSGILFVTSRAPHPFFSPMYQVPVGGGVPTPLAMDQARDAAISPDGSMVAFNRRGVSTTRKGYKGNNSADVWVQDVASGEIRQLTDTDLQGFREHVNDGVPMWGSDGLIYFLSERDGVYNIWRIAPAGGEATQVTRHQTGGVKYPSISPDGRTIIYTHEHELWTVEVPDGQPQKLVVELDFDPTTNLVEWVEVENRAESYGASPDGERVAVDFRGEIFIVPSDSETGEKVRVTESAWRDRYPSWSPDGEYLAYVSDEEGDEQIWLYTVADGTRRKLTDHDSQKGGDLVWAPDGGRFVFEAANRILEVEVPSGRTTELAYNEAGGFSVSGYSSDGEWLVYDRRDEDLSSQVYLFERSSRREIDVTDNPYRNYDGTLTPDGTHVLFRSNRDDGTTHLYSVSLTRIAEDPDDPLVKARDEEEEEEEDEEEDEEQEEDETTRLDLRIETEGIGRRAVALTSGSEGAGSYFLSRDGETVFFTSEDDDGPGLFRVPVAGGEAEKVTDGSFGGLRPTANGRVAFFSRGGPGTGSEVHRMELPSGRNRRVDFSFTVEVDHRAEWEQIFHESWRVMKYRFYDEDMHGRDWDAIRAAYAPLLPHVGTYEDAYELANQMIGELNASHVGVGGSPSRPQESGYRTAYLGFELEPADDRYRVTHVYRDGPADEEWLDIEPGDWVLAIDGQEVRAGDNYWQILNHTLNDYVPVRVADDASGTGTRELRIRTTGSLRNIQYEEWVERNREYVEEVSGGRIAYVHIRSMNQSSLERFENEINRFWNAQGIVVDIRYNGGGNIDQQLIDILERRPYEYWNSRWGAPSWGRRPRQAIAGPKVMLINHRSGSDSEVTPMGFRDLGLGRIVGNPTMGAVIATGSYGLIHGGSIRTPGSLVVTYDPTKPNNHGINLENYGVAPDVWVENTPQDELDGFDRELDEAVKEALRMLSEGRWQYVTDEAGGGSGG